MESLRKELRACREEVQDLRKALGRVCKHAETGEDPVGAALDRCEAHIQIYRRLREIPSRGQVGDRVMEIIARFLKPKRAVLYLANKQTGELGIWSDFGFGEGLIASPSIPPDLPDQLYSEEENAPRSQAILHQLLGQPRFFWARLPGKRVGLLLGYPGGNPAALAIGKRDLVMVRNSMELIGDLLLRHETERALSESEALQQSFFRNVPVGLYRSTRKGRFLSVNPAMVSQFGFTSTDDLMHVKLANLYRNPADREKMVRALNGIDSLVNYEVELCRKDGSIFWGRLNLRASKDRKGRVVFDGSCEDISARHFAELEKQHHIEEMSALTEGAIAALSHMGAMRDSYTALHQKRVARLSRAIAEQMNLPPAAIQAVYLAGLLHDIGKVQVPAEILNKSGKLGKSEWDIIRGHAHAGYCILRNIEFEGSVAEAVYQHHERLDGSGYPEGIKGEAILLEARIIAVADTVEAMSYHRPHRPAPGLESALVEIEENAGRVLDENVVQATLTLFREQGYSMEEKRAAPKTAST